MPVEKTEAEKNAEKIKKEQEQAVILEGTASAGIPKSDWDKLKQLDYYSE